MIIIAGCPRNGGQPAIPPATSLMSTNNRFYSWVPPVLKAIAGPVWPRLLEPMSALTHFTGAIAAAFGTLLLVWLTRQDIAKMTSLAVYGLVWLFCTRPVACSMESSYRKVSACGSTVWIIWPSFCLLPAPIPPLFIIFFRINQRNVLANRLFRAITEHLL